MSFNNVHPQYINVLKSPCKAGCQGIQVTTYGPKKYRLTTGDCRAPSSDDCCLKIGRENKSNT